MSTTEAETTCARCAIRHAVLDYFNKHVGDDAVGKFVDGLLDAAAMVAAFHVVEGHESDERTVLLDQLGKSYDRALIGEGAVH